MADLLKWLNGKKTTIGAIFGVVTLLIGFLSGAADVLTQAGVALPVAAKITAVVSAVSTAVGLAHKAFKTFFGEAQ